MCGISGIVSRKGHVIDRDLISRMNKRQAHRGPDDEGVWVGENVGMGHRRLSILDLSSAGHQPMISRDGNKVIAYNGEVYNFREIRRELQSRGYRFKSDTDTEVVLAAFEEWGECCLSKFNGMFAFAIWNALERRMCLARDRFGVKPLYYYCDDHWFAFASEIKALFVLPFVSRDPNFTTAFGYLEHGLMDGPEETFFQKIRKVPPSTLAVISESGLAFRQWYKLPSTPNAEPPVVADAAARVLELFEDAVRLRFVSDVPVVSTLSGGFDSTCVVSLAVKHLQQTGGQLPHPTYTACFGGAAEDERPYVDLASRDLPLDVRCIMIEPRNLLEQLRIQTLRQDQPVMSAAMIAKGEVFHRIHKDRIKVVLEGQGVDEYGCGYTDAVKYSIADDLRQGRLFGASRQLRHWADLGGISFWQGAKQATDLAFPTAMKIASGIKRMFFSPHHRFVDAGSWLKPVKQSGNRLSPRRTYASRLLDDYCIHQMYSGNLPFYLRCDDHNSMAFSVEARQPFLDYRLVDYVMTLPGCYRIRNAMSKWIFREAMAGVVPEAIRTFPGKRAFPTPESTWFAGAARAEIESYFDSQEFRRSQLFNCHEVKQLFQRFCHGESRLRATIWRILNYGIWWACFVDEN